MDRLKIGSLANFPASRVNLSGFCLMADRLYSSAKPDRFNFRQCPVKIFLSLMLFMLIAGCSTPYEFKGVPLENPRTVYNMTGVDESGTPFQLSNHSGQYILVNFGYTFCPDICPLTLSELAQFYRSLAEEEEALAEQVQVIFVTVDPERDTVDTLAAYVGAFHSDFHGVHIGNPDELERTKQSFAVFSEIVPNSDDPNSYLVNHTGGILVINPEGDWIHFFPHDIAAEDLLADMLHLLKS